LTRGELPLKVIAAAAEEEEPVRLIGKTPSLQGKPFLYYSTMSWEGS
jgi:hypothetical protein